MDFIMGINNFINEIVWSWPMLVLIVGTGIFFTTAIGFRSFTKLGYVFKQTLFKMFEKESKGEGEVTAFEAVSTALAATVGTGNIAGVATAITIGGPGAVFWMWIAALFGMATKFAEVVLSIEYREKTDDGHYVGGPMYYIKKGTNQGWLAGLFALFGAMATFGIGNMTQSNSVADVMHSTFNIEPLITGIVLAIFVGMVTIGGIKSISKVTSILVPFMAAIYIVGGLIIIIVNIDLLPDAISTIVQSAFTGHAAVGGFAGSTITLALHYGVARGVFTNEAGMGSAPIAHAAATTDHPVRQGLWGIFEVFADTILIASITGIIIVMSGLWESGVGGASLTSEAFEIGLPFFGEHIVTFGLLFFAFSTVLGWSYYGEKCIEYLFSSKVILPYRILFMVMVVVGSIGGLTEIWEIADTLNGLMIIPNLIGILWLSPVVVKLTKDYFGTGGIYQEEEQ